MPPGRRRRRNAGTGEPQPRRARRDAQGPPAAHVGINLDLSTLPREILCLILEVAHIPRSIASRANASIVHQSTSGRSESFNAEEFIQRLHQNTAGLCAQHPMPWHVRIFQRPPTRHRCRRWPRVPSMHTWGSLPRWRLLRPSPAPTLFRSHRQDTRCLTVERVHTEPGDVQIQRVGDERNAWYSVPFDMLMEVLLQIPRLEQLYIHRIREFPPGNDMPSLSSSMAEVLLRIQRECLGLRRLIFAIDCYLPPDEPLFCLVDAAWECERYDTFGPFDRIGTWFKKENYRWYCFVLKRMGPTTQSVAATIEQATQANEQRPL